MDLVRVLDVLDCQEPKGKADGKYDIEDEPARLPLLGASHRPRGGETARQQDGRIDGTELPIQEVVGPAKHVGVLRAVDGIGAEEAGKKQNLRDEEDPYPQFAGIELMLRSVEVMRKHRISGVYCILVE
ncbi:MAG: hypothetical protein QM784_26745 [Polyangiaceae bacterium]